MIAVSTNVIPTAITLGVVWVLVSVPFGVVLGKVMKRGTDD